MAIVKFINSKDKKKKELSYGLNYALDKTKVAQNESIESLFEEALILTGLVSGINCRPSSAFDEMMFIKNLYNKTEGRRFIHFVHSFHPKEDITPELAHEINLKLLEHEKFKDFQILAITHTNKPHIHTHCILNTVNIETGRKWQQCMKDMVDISIYSNKLCHEFGLKYSFPEFIRWKDY